MYVSFATIVTTNLDIYHCIARACEGLGVQLVITRGNNKSRSRAFEALPAVPPIVDYAPQIELLPPAAITIGHGGANTVLESLACGVPVIAIPITNDQPGMGARLNRSGAGAMVLLRNLSARPASERHRVSLLIRLIGWLQRYMGSPSVKQVVLHARQISS